MKNKLKVVSALLVAIILIPQIASASWWNPFTWKIFKRTPPVTQVVVINQEETTTPNNLSTKSSGIFDDLDLNTESTNNTNKSSSRLDEYLTSISKENSNETKKTNTDKTSIEQYKLKANETIKLLTTDKSDFETLKKGISEHKNQATSLANDLFKKYNDLYDTTASSRSGADREFILAGKNYLSNDTGDLLKKIETNYSSIAFYTRNTALNKDQSEALEFDINKIKKCLELSDIEQSKKSECRIGYLDLILESHTSQRQTLQDGLDALKKVDSLVLGMIRSKFVEVDSDLNSRKGTLSSFDDAWEQSRASFSMPSYQVPTSTPSSGATNCSTTATGDIWNRKYTTTCKPDTRTPEQICASKKANWVSGGARINDKPDC